MEVLSDLLHGVKATGSVYFCDYLRPPWSLDYAGEPRALFHRLRRGLCELQVDDQSITLATGDLVFIAPGVDHRVVNRPGDDDDALLLCGYCTFDAEFEPLLRQHLPRFAVLSEQQMELWPWLLRTLDHLAAEYLSDAPGNDLTVNKLSEVLLVQLLRCNFGRDGDIGLVSALRDRRLRAALSALHDAPGEEWTLERSAAIATMSRSGFARRFRESLGETWYEYLTQLRMRRARALLSNTMLPTGDVAERVGYRSELAFRRVFRKRHGVTPRAYRLENDPGPA